MERAVEFQLVRSRFGVTVQKERARDLSEGAEKIGYLL
jgi:hypothetical protein